MEHPSALHVFPIPTTSVYFYVQKCCNNTVAQALALGYLASILTIPVLIRRKREEKLMPKFDQNGPKEIHIEWSNFDSRDLEPFVVSLDITLALMPCLKKFMH